MRLKLQCDGGSRGNPGLAGAGATIVDAAAALHDSNGSREGNDSHDGAGELAAHWEYIEQATNNVAEYRGLINGLELAQKFAALQGVDAGEVAVDVFMDSKLIVEQMSGRWKIKNADLKPLAAEVKRLEAELEAVTYTWVPRAQNKRADELANRAMDDKASGEWIAESESPDVSQAPQGGEPESNDAEPAYDPDLANVAEPAKGAEQANDSATAKGSDGRAASAASTRVPDSEEPSNSPSAGATAPAWHGGQRPTRFLLVRHGESTMNAERKFTGLSDPELTEAGRWQAVQVGRYIALRGGVHAVISSPLSRARETALAIATPLGLEVSTEPGLIEMDFGQWEGRTFADVRESAPEEYHRISRDASASPPDGECPNDVFERVKATIDTLSADFEGQTVVLVSHVTPIKSVLRYALGAGTSMYATLHLGLASLSIAEFYPDKTGLVRRVNDTHYLERY